ncbi:MAG TPA: hypothetical protein VG328_10280 [Stellaceae bacterium]|jgi:hypothetical protein|nr:hypothetical protein [Stellaceae bacterium]
MTYSSLAIAAALSLGTVPAAFAGQSNTPQTPQSGSPSCKLLSKNNRIQHVVYLQFDNVHLRRDNPNVPSDLEQMPNLLNFLQDNGTMLGNHFTPLISHTSVDIVTALTGVYGEKFGVSIGNSFGLFNSAGVASFPSSFTYWTDKLSDGLYEMVDQGGKNAPAPWVPFTRAGCDVGAFSLANLEFENVTSDITNVFGAGSPQAQEASTNSTKAIADFEGITVHCAKGSALCAKNGAPDLLPDEPGGYDGFQALYGNVNVAPAINNGAASVNDLDGNPVADSHGNPGFPGFDPRPAQSLGYVATMLEAGVPVVYFYIEDAHDNDPALSGVSSSVEQTFGPGEAGYVAGLKAYDKAFGQFFDRLAKDGITKDNTLFVVTADENDHFVGGPPSPATCDGVNVPCTYAKKGEIDADLSLVYATEFNNTTPFRVHSDDAPTFYINGNPGQTDPLTRTLEQQAGAMTGFDTVANNGLGGTNHVTLRMADQAEQSFLHMITVDPNRTPNFILFGNDDYFLSASGKTSPLCTPAGDAASCFAEGPGFAWNHGDFQTQITRTWLGMVGPGVQNLGRFDGMFSDHTDVRPTIINLVGLTDDYAHDGRVLTEVIKQDALPQSLRQRQDLVAALGQAYKQINAPRGELGRKTLNLSTTGLAADNATYSVTEATINQITAQRNTIAGQMIDMIEAAEFDNTPIDPTQAQQLIDQANTLLGQVP